MSSTLLESVGSGFGLDRVDRRGVSRARAVAPVAAAALGFRPALALVPSALPLAPVVLALLLARALVPLALALVPLALARPRSAVALPLAVARPAVAPPVVLFVLDPLLVATANLLARLPALWRRRRPLRVMYPQVEVVIAARPPGIGRIRR